MLMNKLVIIYAIVCTIVLGLFLLRSGSTSESPMASVSPASNPSKLPQRVQGVKLNKIYAFAGEQVPTQNNFDVRERLDRELMVNSYWHSSTALNIKKSFRYFPVIEPLLREYNIPDDLKYLAVAESNLSHATSPAGAKGLWQFMPVMANYYELEVNKEIDERFHTEKLTRAACQYLLQLKERFGSWTLAAAAYNMGETRLAKDLGLQGSSSYYDLNLNEETSRYIFRILAIKDIMTNPEQFGFYLAEEDGYKPLDQYREVIVTKTIENLGDFASKNGTTYRMLKVYNPWLLSHKLTVRKGKEYTIRIPK